MNINLSNQPVVKETEKAICFNAHGTSWGMGSPYISFDVWIPKSQIKDGNVPAWLLETKGAEKGVKSIDFLQAGVSIKVNKSNPKYNFKF